MVSHLFSSLYWIFWQPNTYDRYLGLLEANYKRLLSYTREEIDFGLSSFMEENT